MAKEKEKVFNSPLSVLNQLLIAQPQKCGLPLSEQNKAKLKLTQYNFCHSRALRCAKQRKCRMCTTYTFQVHVYLTYLKALLKPF